MVVLLLRRGTAVTSLLLLAIAVPSLLGGSSSSGGFATAFSPTKSLFHQVPQNEIGVRPIFDFYKKDGISRRGGGGWSTQNQFVQPFTRRGRRRATTRMASAMASMPFWISAGDSDAIATGLGYLLGAGSLGLYTPIAIRVVRQKSAKGLVTDTWWLKLASYTCSDIYFVRNQYPISTYIETLIITFEAAIILGLVSYYQSQNQPNPQPTVLVSATDAGSNEEDPPPSAKTTTDGGEGVGGEGVGGGMTNFLGRMSLYTAITGWGLTTAPPTVVALGQGLGSSLLNTCALIPQFALNARTQSSGDYSPVTAGIAATGCAIRIYTIIQLADSDPILLGSFGLALVLNTSLLSQILWYGVTSEGKSISSLLLSDFMDTSSPNEDVDEDMTVLVEMDMKNTRLVKERVVARETQEEEEEEGSQVR